MPQFSFNNINKIARQTLGTLAARAANNLLPSSVKTGGLGGDVGWYSYGGGMLGGLMGPAGAGQLNIALSRFRNLAEFEGAFVADDTVHSCVSLRSETFARLNFKLRHRDTGTILEEEAFGSSSDFASSSPLFRSDPREWLKYRELVKLLRHPNPYQTWYDFAAMNTMFYDLSGNIVMFKDNQNGLGWPEFMWPLNPAWVQPVVDASEGLLGYYYQAGPHLLTLEPEDVIHIRRTNPASYFWGMGVIQALAGVLDAQVGIDEYQRGFFANGAVLSGVIYSDGKPDPQQFKLLKSEIKDQFQGVRNHFKVALLTGGMKWQNVSLSQTDMGMKDWKELGQDRIMKAFRVPKSKLGAQDDAQYNKLDAADRMFYKEAITPLAEMWQRSLNLGLCLKYGYEIIFDVPQYDDMQEMTDIAARIDSLKSLTLWEKRQTMKQLMGPHLKLEDDPDSPFSPDNPNYQGMGDKDGDNPQMHYIYNEQGQPIASLQSGKRVTYTDAADYKEIGLEIENLLQEGGRTYAEWE